MGVEEFLSLFLMALELNLKFNGNKRNGIGKVCWQMQMVSPLNTF